MSKPFERVSKADWLKDIEKYLKHDVKVDNLRIENNVISVDPFYTAQDNIPSRIVESSGDGTKNMLTVDDAETAARLISTHLNLAVEAILFHNFDYKKGIELIKEIDRSLVDIIVVSIDSTDYELWRKEDGITTYNYLLNLTSGNNVIEGLKEQIKTSQSALITYNTSENFYQNIAELRAIRSILSEIGYNYHIVSKSVSVNENAYGDKNLIELTYKTLAAVLGQVDYVAYDANRTEEELRLCYNIIRILIEESGINRVIDPLSGSYFVESYTNQLISSFSHE